MNNLIRVSRSSLYFDKLRLLASMDAKSSHDNCIGNSLMIDCMRSKLRQMLATYKNPFANQVRVTCKHVDVPEKT